MNLSLQQTWPAPTNPRPIVIIGGGDIVRDAHIPTYKKAGIPVLGVFDLNRQRAVERVQEIGGSSRVFESMEEACRREDVIFDCATPPKAHLAALSELPDRSAVLLQKPMGTRYEQARAIAELCRRKSMTAAINFQLRFSPNMLAIRDLIQRGLLGEIVDIDMNMNVSTPWDLFPFLQEEDRVEIVIHSVHYLDLIRSYIGNPKGAYARTCRHPNFPKIASTKSSIILDYGDILRVCLSINHDYPFGGRREDSILRVQGTEGVATTRLGVQIDYPRGKQDVLEVKCKGVKDWVTIPLCGNWFPDAFIGPMNNLQRVVAGEDKALVSPVEDALQTMSVVEACYRSNAQGGVPLPE